MKILIVTLLQSYNVTKKIRKCTTISEAMSGRNPNKVNDNVDDMFDDILNEE